MKLQAVFILVFMASSCLAGIIIKASNEDESFRLVNATLEVMTFCYKNQVNVVGFVGNSSGSVITTFQSSISIAVTLLDRTRRILSHDSVPIEHRSKLQVFVVTASSPTELKKILRGLKNSVWWNHMASIFTLYWPLELKSGCSKAFEILFIAWEMNLLNTTLICINVKNEILIYTYNPYINVAPDSWKVENIYNEKNDDPWTLLVRKYEKDKKICKDLYFDKTKNLGGFGIRSSVKNIYNETISDINTCESERLGLNEVAILKMVFCALNGTLEFFIYNYSTQFNFMDENGRDILMDAVEGNSDILLNARYTIGKNIKTTYPRIYAGLCVTTQYSGQMSQLNKILSVVDSSSRYGILVVIVITIFFFIFVLRQRTIEATLNVLRIICNGSVPIILTSLAIRFYMGCLFIFVVTIQALYQGQMATLLTKPVLLDNINTMQDLIDGNHKVYVYKTLAEPFLTSAFKGRLFVMEKIDCTDNVLHDSSAACVTDCTVAIKTSRGLRLYLSTDPIIKATMSYVIRDDWPLESQVNKILATLFETNIIWYWGGKKFDDILEIQKYYENHEESHQFRIITLDQLIFAFVILVIGLSCATIFFVVEIGIPRLRSNMTNVTHSLSKRLCHMAYK